MHRSPPPPDPSRTRRCANATLLARKDRAGFQRGWQGLARCLFDLALDLRHRRFGPLVFAGTFSATPPAVGTTQGSLDNGEYDTNIGGTLNGQIGPIGMGFYVSGNDATHCVFDLQPQWGILTYNAYPVSATEAFLVEVDSVPTTPYVSALDMKQQTGYPFQTQGVFSSSLAGGLSGQYLDPTATLVPEAEVIQIAPTSNGAFNLLLTDNTGGAVLTNMQTSGSSPAPLSV